MNKISCYDPEVQKKGVFRLRCPEDLMKVEVDLSWILRTNWKHRREGWKVRMPHLAGRVVKLGGGVWSYWVGIGGGE